MPNFVSEILLTELRNELKAMGSCLIVSFDKLTVADAEEVRRKFRSEGLRYRVVKNSLAVRAFRELNLDLAASFQGKCGVVLAPEERAIAAAKLVRELMAKRKGDPPLVVTGGVIEGQPITGTAARGIADMPDKQTVRTQLAIAVAGPARSLATCVQALASGLARCIQARIDKQGAQAQANAAG
jgi:large subunit ribosomal protein L10